MRESSHVQGRLMSIHTRLATAVSAAVVAAAMALPASASPSIPLNSGQEPAGGEAGGHGFFSYTIDGTEFCWTLSWRGHRRSGRRPRPRRPAPCCRRYRHRPRHRRRGRPGRNRLPCDHRGVGCGHHLRPRSLLRQPAQRWYVNLHNAGFQAGAIRGQLK
jgi:CHRD domain